MIFTWMLLAIPSASMAQTDSLGVDSVTWSKELDGVTVVHQKRLVKMEVDKMTYNVSEDKDSKSKTVLDMLRKVPMVTVDGEDNITVTGSSSFKILVDGIPNVLFSQNPSMVFKSMPATAVKSIEVITNPGAQVRRRRHRRYPEHRKIGVFTDEERLVFRKALQDLSEKMSAVALTL